MSRQLSIVLVAVLALCPAASAQSITDTNASYTGPFAGAQIQSEMAQSFEISVTGFLNGIDAYVPTNSGPSCEFTWYLRNGASLDPQNPDISALPMLASGTGMSDTPAQVYQAAPSVLLTGANLPVTAGDVLVLHIVRDCNFLWIAGAGLLPGDRYQYDGVNWTQSSVINLEFGRTIYVTQTTAVDEVSWGLMKVHYR